MMSGATSPANLQTTNGVSFDAALTYNFEQGGLDAVLTGTDFAVDNTPASVLLHALLVDRRAHPDDVWPTPVPDWSHPDTLTARRGWVGDALDASGQLVGSRLWELERRLANEQTRADCQNYLVEALTPLEQSRGYAVKIQVSPFAGQTLPYSVTAGATTIQFQKAFA